MYVCRYACVYVCVYMDMCVCVHVYVYTDNLFPHVGNSRVLNPFKIPVTNLIEFMKRGNFCKSP